MLNSLMFKLHSFLSGGNILSSVFAADGDVINTFDAGSVAGGVFSLITNFLIDALVKIIYTICSFVMSLIDLMQFVISAILGIDVNIDDYVLIDYNNPLIKMMSSNTFSRVFRAFVGIAIVLIIVFTIFSIIKSEYNYAANSGPFVSKARILGRSLRSFFIMFIFPSLFLFIIVIVNAILAGFNNILKADNTSATLGGQIFISSAYQANNYRQYADANKRIPITISFDDPISMGIDSDYTTDELRSIYGDFEERGKNLYNNFADINFGSFTDTLIYRNNKVINQSNYSGYESFFCTREQYYVMADFIDYAVKSNMTYYVKNMTDADIDWGYVDEAVYNKTEGTLTITYRDTEYLNDGESYTVVYAPETEDVSSPISDAIDTVSALLGIGEYSDNVFNILNRLEDTINVVEWGNKKVLIKFSDSVRNVGAIDVSTINDLGTETDRIIFYEAHKYKYNNTLHYTLNELADGVELPVQKLEKRKYQPSTASYVTYEEYYVVKINNTYYVVEEDKSLIDNSSGYVDYYYRIIDPVTGTSLTETNVNDFTTYLKDNESAWSEITREKTNGTIETTIPAEKIYIDNGEQGKYEPEFGDRFEDANANGVWDEEYVTYTIYDDLLTDVIKQISWPQKLINDLQVIYADININQLITTNKWLEQLGAYHAAEQGSDFGDNNISTALIHPLGLIMSEFFLGEVAEADNSNAYGTLMFNSKYDEETIKALLLSIMGEANYFQLKAELEYFCEIFNVYMGPVLDEIAYYENFELGSGNNASVQLYTYKAYLASVLLSASTAEWMYETATNFVGNSNFIRDITIADYNSPNFGAYKQFSELEQKGEIQALYDNYNAELANQYIKKGDDAYPEYMDALYEYIYGGDDAFNGRLNNVLTSYKSSLGRELDAINRYNEIINAYKAVETAISGFSYEQEIKAILIEPTAEYWAVDRSGDRKNTITGETLGDGTFNSGSGDEIVKFVNKGTADDFTATQTATATRNLLNLVQSMRDTFSYRTSNASSTLNGVTLPDELGDYYTAITSYVYTKLEYFEDDTSSQLVGKRDELENDLDKHKKVIKNMLKNYYDSLKDEINNPTLVALLKLSAGKTADEIMDKIADQDSVSSWINGGIADSVAEVKIADLSSYFSQLGSSQSWNEFWNNITSLQGKTISVYISNDMNKDDNNFDEGKLYIPSSEPALIDYYNAVRTIDKLDRYNITFGVSSLYSQKTDTVFEVVVNNKKYDVGQNFTKAKFIEYVLGAEYLEKIGYDTVFIDENYKGLLSLDSEGKLVGSFNRLQEFLVGLGDISVKVAQMTNFVNLAANAYDDIKIGAQAIDLTGLNSSDPDYPTLEENRKKDCETNLSKHILNWILTDSNNLLEADLISALFNLDLEYTQIEKVDNVYKYGEENYQTFEEAAYAMAKGKALEKLTTSSDAEADRILNNVLSYLMLTDTNPIKQNYVDYTKLTLRELRLMCFDALKDYEKQEGQSVKQNEKRYLAIFGLACADWIDSSGNGAKNNSWDLDRKSDIKGLTTHKQSQATLLRLAGLENRPYEELVSAEYSFNIKENSNIADEANGDVFIICTYDDDLQAYVPFLMGNNKAYKAVTYNGKTWHEKYGYYAANTNYYLEEHYYPVIAKGVISEDGKPTAIRKNGDNVEYYREDVVIHNVSEMELSVYYVSAEQVAVKHSLVSNVANMFSKALTGKTLVEHLVSKIPKFAAHSDYKFCYGTQDSVVDESQDGKVCATINFNKKAGLKMENLYDANDINLLILLIGTVTMFAAIWKALWAIIQRMFDVAIYYLIGPAVISTIALRSDSKDDDGNLVEGSTDAYSSWKQTLSAKLLSVFSLAVGFNIFFIVVPIISNVNLFSNQVEYESLLTYSSIFKNIDYTLLNEIGRLVLTVAAAYLSTRAVDLFASVLVISNSFKEGEQTLTNVKKSIKQAGDHISGQYALDKTAEAIKMTKNLIPGMVFIEKGIEETVKATTKAVADVSAKTVGKVTEWAIVGASMGKVPPQAARAAGKWLEKKMKAVSRGIGKGVTKAYKGAVAENNQERAARESARSEYEI